MIVKSCGMCGVNVRVKLSHANVEGMYCSRDCMAKGYQTRLVGSANPNFKNAGHKVCDTCKSAFHSYNKTRRFCSLRCRSLAPANIVRLRKMATMPKRHFNQHRPCKLDANHKVIVEALIAVGASVIDTSSLGHGAPDLIVGFVGRTFLIEIKNPKTRYGRKGLNPYQVKWWETWTGVPPAMVYSIEEALQAIGLHIVSPGMYSFCPGHSTGSVRPCDGRDRLCCCASRHVLATYPRSTP